MRGRGAKLISILVCAAVMLTTVILTRTELHGAVPNPLLYWNDRNWPYEDRQPIEKRLNIYYIPLTIFNQFENYEVRTNSRQKTFIIEYNDGEKFLSFDTTRDFALNQDNEQIYIPTYELHDERYVPAQEICRRLGLTFEKLTSAVTGEVAIRISDGNNEYSFEELVRRKYPGFFKTETVTTETTAQTTAAPPPVTNPPTTPAVTEEPQPVLTDRTIYITIEDSPGEYTGDILGTLEEFGCKATFFVSGKSISENPAMLARIAAGGHAIGLHTMGHNTSGLTDADAILADIEAENELLYGYIKQKSRLWRAPEGSSALKILNAKCELLLNQAGYIVWDWNVAATGSTVTRAANAVIKGIWDNETAVIRIVEGKNSAAILRSVLTFISENSEACDVRTITPACYEYNLIKHDY